MVEMVEGNLAQWRGRLAEMLAAGRLPLVLLDLDGTLNRHYQALVDEQAVFALRRLAAAGGLVGLNTGADIVWASDRILSETDPHFPFAFLVLATGRQVYAWVESLRAYALLPVQGTNKGEAMRALADYLDLPLDQFVFVADFPGTGDQQEGIDDAVLREPVGVIVNVGQGRDPRELACTCATTLLLHPERRDGVIAGCGCEATVSYLDCLTALLADERQNGRLNADWLEMQRRLERRLGIEVNPEGRRRGAFALWTFERPCREVAAGHHIRIHVGAPGLVHAGASRNGRWLRTYDVPLRQTIPGTWEADLLDPAVNEFTFIWFDATRGGRVRWEGRNIHVRRVPS